MYRLFSINPQCFVLSEYWDGKHIFQDNSQIIESQNVMNWNKLICMAKYTSCCLTGKLRDFYFKCLYKIHYSNTFTHTVFLY